MEQLDRFKGCLIGLAVGDAVGTTLEFKRPGSFKPITDMVGGGPFNLKPGQWTDDTSMALCLATSLVECKGFDPGDQMDRYCRWWKEGYMSSTGHCFDIGGTTATALSKYQRTGNPYAGSTNNRFAGNGSLMRLAPVPIFYASNPAQAAMMAAESSKTTHGAETCLDACSYYAEIIIKAFAGASKEEILAPPAPGIYCEAIQAVADGSYKKKQPPAIKGTGYVVDSLEAALWAFYTTDNFRDGCLAAANLGDDADTTAAIYGQLAGAFYGVEGIPQKWLGKLAMRQGIEALAVGLQGIQYNELNFVLSAPNES